MQNYFDVVQDVYGKAIAGAAVAVYDENGNLATLYSDNIGTLKVNPLSTNSDGEYDFYAANGRYSLNIYITGYASQTKSGIILFDPAEPDATADINYLASGAGAVERTLQEVLQDTVSVKDFGAVGDGVANDTAAIQAAIDAVFADGGGTIQFPFGRYKVTSQITLRSGVALYADSQFGAQITVATPSITVFSGVNVVNVGFSGIDFACTAANVTALDFLNSNRVYLSKIMFYGCLNNVIYDLGGFLSMENCASVNSGALKSGRLVLKSSDDTKYGAVFSSIVDYRIENNGAGVQSPAIYCRRAVGVKITNLLTTNNAAHGTGTCVLIENDCQGITISNGLIVDYDIGVRFQTGAGINKPPLVNILSHVDFDQCRTNSVLFDSGVGNQIVGGIITSSFVGTDKQAIVLNANAGGNAIMGTYVGGYYDPNGAGIYLNGCADNRLFNVQVAGCYSAVAFNGSVTQTFISTCDFSLNVPNPFAGSFSGAGNRIIDIKGYSAANAVTSPAMPASTVGVTNTFGVACRVFIFGGTFTVVSINGNTCGNGPNWYLLMPGEIIAVTYSSAPSWNWVGI